MRKNSQKFTVTFTVTFTFSLMKRTKLRDIAEALQVSVTTVSRALNNKSDININTKQAVLDMASKLNYKPNNLAVSLRKSDNLNVVGVILPIVGHPFFSSILQGILRKAREYQYFVLVGESNHEAQKEKQILEEFTDFGVSGILLAPSKHSDFSKNVLSIIHTRTPVVVIDRMYDNYNGNYCLLYTSPSPRDQRGSRMPSSA